MTAARTANEFGDETVDHFDYEHVHKRGNYAARLPHPLSWLVRGLEGAVPRQVHVSDERSQRHVDRALYRNPIKEQISPPDFLYLTRMLLSLLAVLFAFDTVCGEREDGTLKQTLAGAVPRHLWLMGKWIGGMATLSIGFLLGSLIGLLYLVLQGLPGLSEQQLATFALTLIVALLYMSLFYTLGMWISTLVRQASTSVVVSLLVWALVTLVLPGLVVEFGKVLSPSPARAAVIVNRNSVEKGIRVAIRKSNNELREDRAERTAKASALRADRVRRLEELEDGYWRGVFVQAETVKTLARVVPSGCLTHALTGLAGTDVPFVSEFQAAYKRTISAYAASLRSPQPNTISPTLDISHRDLWERLNGVVLDIGLLAIYLIVLFAATYIGFLRYDVR